MYCLGCVGICASGHHSGGPINWLSASLFLHANDIMATQYPLNKSYYVRTHRTIKSHGIDRAWNTKSFPFNLPFFNDFGISLSANPAQWRGSSVRFFLLTLFLFAAICDLHRIRGLTVQCVQFKWKTKMIVFQSATCLAYECQSGGCLLLPFHHEFHFIWHNRRQNTRAKT